MNIKNLEKKIIHLVVAARPNFMKVAPLYRALINEAWAHPMIVHTGQHYDLNMSDAFFKDLSIPEPDIYLGVGSGSHAEQTGQVMMKYERYIFDGRPDLTVGVGDVNSTMAVTLAAVKLGVKVAHLEAGLRSFDRSMPEEINRIVTDALADMLWTPSPDADENLNREGIPSEKITRVGNIMIDSLEMLRNKIESQTVYKNFGVGPKEYAIITIHRPSNVDNPETLKELCKTLVKISRHITLIFPIHPRTHKNLVRHNLMTMFNTGNGIFLPEPLSYINFMNLLFNCRFVITDSGGIQEETTYLGIPCLTMRPNTERPITITHGTNQLCKMEELEVEVEGLFANKTKKASAIELWDGKTAGRVVDSIKAFI